ncbi:hypothetical protein V8E53_004192 [Lactarius tabidus]
MRRRRRYRKIFIFLSSLSSTKVFVAGDVVGEIVMEKSGSEPRSGPEPDLAELQIRVWVRDIDPDRTVGSVRGLAHSRTLANGF